MVHHDRDTLAWSDDAADAADRATIATAARSTTRVVTSDPPPWWRVHKKNALFYNGMARGDHRGTMVLATSVCVDDVDAGARASTSSSRTSRRSSRSVRAPALPARDRRGPRRGRARRSSRATAPAATAPTPTTRAEARHLPEPADPARRDRHRPGGGRTPASCTSPQLVDWYNGSFYGEHHAHGAERPVPRLHAAAARRHLGDRAVPPQRLGADRRAGAEQPGAPAVLAARRPRQPQLRRGRARLAVRSRSTRRKQTRRRAERKFVYDTTLLEPVERRPHLRRPPDATPSGAR